MATFDPTLLKEIREQFAWSAGDLGDFLGRAKATIYYWENGENPPGEAMSAIIECLHREMERRKREMSANAFESWVEELKDLKVRGFLEHLQQPAGHARDGGPPGTITQIATGSRETESPMLCLLPIREAEFEELMALMSDQPEASRQVTDALLSAMRERAKGASNAREELLNHSDA